MEQKKYSAPLPQAILWDYLAEYLAVERFAQEAPVNGVNVAGTRALTKVAFGMAPNLRLFEKAHRWGAEAIVTHHSLFEAHTASLPLLGYLRARVQFLLSHDLTLASYHLPLDYHDEVGNNALMVRALGAHTVRMFGRFAGFSGIIYHAHFEVPVSREELARRCASCFGQVPKTVLKGPRTIRDIAVVAGGGHVPVILQQLEHGTFQAYVTGEIAEHVPPIAEELDINFYAVGHYTCETLGVQALAKKVRRKFSALQTKFIPVPVPY